MRRNRAPVVLLYIGLVPLPELKLIERLRRQARRPYRLANKLGDPIAGIGDDCAVLRGSDGYDLLVTTDFSLENVHFKRSWHPPESIGHRCLARGLSDIAAMGGEATAAFLSLGLPMGIPQPWVDGFVRGFLALAKSHGVVLAGGDTADSPGGVVADVIVLGRVPRGQAVTRSGARPGDAIYLTGTLGGSGAVLQELRAGKKPNPRVAAKRVHFFPEPRLKVGQWLRQRRLASAMIDLSDGLSTDLNHLCVESGVSAKIRQRSLPIASNAHARGSPHRGALDWGEDYELLFAAAADAKLPKQIAGVPVARIGEMIAATGRPKITIIAADGRPRELKPHGWQHFQRQHFDGKQRG